MLLRAQEMGGYSEWSKPIGTILHDKWKLSQRAQEALSWAKLGEDHLLKVVRQDLNKGDKTPVGSMLHEVCWGARVKWIIFGGANTVLDHKDSLRKKNAQLISSFKNGTLSVRSGEPGHWEPIVHCLIAGKEGAKYPFSCPKFAWTKLHVLQAFGTKWQLKRLQEAEKGLPMVVEVVRLLWPTKLTVLPLAPLGPVCPGPPGSPTSP